MKKALSATLALCLTVLSPVLASPLPAVADSSSSATTVTDTATGTLSVLDFANIEKEIMARNPVVLANQHLVDSTTYGYYAVNSNLSDLANAQSTLNAQIGPLQTTLNGLQATLAGLKSGTPVAPPTPYTDITHSLTLPSANEGTLLGNDSALYADGLTTAATVYQTTIGNLTANRDALNKQIYQLESQQASLSGTLDQVKLQTQMANKQLVWAAQSLYSAYNKITSQQGDLKNSLALLQKQLDGVNLQVSLGLATEYDVNGVQDKIGDLQLVIDNLSTQANSVKGDLNLLLGQPYDSDLTLHTVSDPDLNAIQAINFKADSDAALAASYLVRIDTKVRDTKQNVANLNEGNYGSGSNEYLQAQADLDKEQVNLVDAARKFNSAFSKAYTDLVSKQKALTTEQAKLKNVALTAAQGQARYDAGLISGIMLNGIQTGYLSEQVKVQNLQNDLQMAYTKYQWMKAGLSL